MLPEDIFWTQPDKIPEQFKSWLARFIARNAMVPINSGQTSGTGSSSGIKYVDFKITDDLTPPTAGDGQLFWTVDEDLDHYRLVRVMLSLSAYSSSGKPSMAIGNDSSIVTYEMLTTNVTCDVGELNSFTAAVPVVINPLNALVHKGDLLSFDIDAAGTGALGFGISLGFSV